MYCTQNVGPGVTVALGKTLQRPTATNTTFVVATNSQKIAIGDRTQATVANAPTRLIRLSTLTAIKIQTPFL